MKAVILAGGAGTRLWPLSTQKIPKQFQKLAGNKTMLQETLARLGFLNPEDIFIATNKEYEKLALKQSKNLIPEENLIIEPALRDTAPCIGYIASILHHKYPDEVMAIIYADHLINKPKELEKKLKVAEKLAKQEKSLNIIEVKAKSPNVNLGYVKTGKKLKKIDNIEIYSFEKFTEKPNFKTAQKFLKSKNYLWNTGLYVWPIKTILEKYKEFQPQTYKIFQKIAASIGTKEEKSVIAKYYPQAEKISIDYAIMEKVNPKEVRIIPADLGWNDIGTWDSLFEELAKNKKTNIAKAKHLGLETENCFILSSTKKLITTIGVQDLIIVQTPENLLICKKGKSQDVKKILNLIKEQYPHLL